MQTVKTSVHQEEKAVMTALTPVPQGTASKITVMLPSKGMTVQPSVLLDARGMTALMQAHQGGKDVPVPALPHPQNVHDMTVQMQVLPGSSARLALMLVLPEEEGRPALMPALQDGKGREAKTPAPQDGLGMIVLIPVRQQNRVC